MQLQIIIKYGSRREYPPERQAAQAYRSCEGRMGGKKSMSSEISKNFIEQMIDKDLAEGVYDTELLYDVLDSVYDTELPDEMYDSMDAGEGTEAEVAE